MKDTNKIYIDIYSILDLRQACLYTLMDDKEKLSKYIISEEYNFRARDIFPDVDNEAYIKLGSSGNVNLLEASSVTYMLTNLKSKVDNMEKRNIYYKENKAPEVVLNIYPFNLTETQSDLLQNLLFVKLKSECLVTIISIPNKELTPIFIKRGGFVSCFIYDFSEWIGLHTKSLEEVKLPDSILYFPAIHKEDPTEEELKRIIKIGFKDVYNYTEFLFSSIATINFLPVTFYSNILVAIHYLEKFNTDIKKNISSSESSPVNLDDVKLPEGI